MSAVSALSSNDVWAVGERFVKGSDFPFPLIEHWDGQRWTIVPSATIGTRNASLAGVAAVSPRDVWAVGRSEANRSTKSREDPLIEHYDGDRWRVVASPALGGGPHEGRELVAISARSADDIWVLGQYSPTVDGESVLRHVLEHWGGHRWMIASSPQDTSRRGTGGLTALSVSPDGRVWAVGSVFHGFSEVSRPAGALVERFDGQTWRLSPRPRGPSGLVAVAAASDRSVWAIGSGSLSSVNFSTGFGSTTQVLRWNGTRWTVSLTMDGIASLVARSTRDVWAVGGTGDHLPLIEHWDGRHWQQLFTSSPAPFPEGLAEVAVAGDGSIVAFGTANGVNELWVHCR